MMMMVAEVSSSPLVQRNPSSCSSPLQAAASLTTRSIEIPDPPLHTIHTLSITPILPAQSVPPSERALLQANPPARGGLGRGHCDSIASDVYYHPTPHFIILSYAGSYHDHIHTNQILNRSRIKHYQKRDPGTAITSITTTETETATTIIISIRTTQTTK
jgi:hypothetical protein